MKKHHVLLTLLSASAATLTALLALLPAHPNAADAEMVVPGRRFTLITHAQAGGGGADEYLSILDVRAGRLIIYGLQGAKLKVINAGDLTRAFQSTGPAPK